MNKHKIFVQLSTYEFYISKNTFTTKKEFQSFYPRLKNLIYCIKGN